MKIRILGAGWYGCHLATALIDAGHDVEVHDCANWIFAGASGCIPARLHLGPHYPRSSKTRQACQRHTADFLARYGHLTRGVAVNLYAIAADRSMVDFDQYTRSLRGEFDFIKVHDPAEFGLRNVEGAILTGERHILSDDARAYFAERLSGRVRFDMPRGITSGAGFDLTIDCTFCANDDAGVDRYEPCLVLLMQGSADRAVTVMDGPFPSLYPWDPARGLLSLSSAEFTPFSKTIRSYGEAKSYLDSLSDAEIRKRGADMIASMAHFYPAIFDFKVAGYMRSIRAMPLSGSDARLVDVRQVAPDLIRVRAGKIDAVIDAETAIMEILK